jgi:hypothetical protein
MRTRARRAVLVCSIMPVAALVLAGCSQTVDPKSAESVITSNISKLGPLKATSVSCPDNVNKKAGTSFSCKVTLVNTTNNATGKGTITLHITNGGNRAVFRGSDVHIR